MTTPTTTAPQFHKDDKVRITGGSTVWTVDYTIEPTAHSQRGYLLRGGKFRQRTADEDRLVRQGE